MKASAVRDAVYDEVSSVDRPANQHSQFVIAKRANLEDAVADNEAEKIFDADGTELDWADLTVGDIVHNEAGAAFEVALDDEPERELAEVGKSAFFAPAAKTEVSKSQLASIREELSKAVTEADQNAVLAKAFESIEKRAEAAEARMAQSESIAKSERDLRLNREYIAKAAEYHVPIEADVLGPVLKSLWEAEDEIGALPKGTCAVIHKALTSSGALLESIGKAGAATNGGDPIAQIDELLDGAITKAANADDSVAKSVTSYFDENPAAYDEYRAARAGR